MVTLFSIQEVEQKDLFFKLNNAFSLSKNAVMGQKISGLYSIYKDDLCLYVGMSTNLPSRIATHLRGKYSNCTLIKFYTPEVNGFEDFYARPKEAQKKILVNNERQLMAIEKPVDNLDIDMDYSIDESESFYFLGEDGQLINIIKIDEELHCKIIFDNGFNSEKPEIYCQQSMQIAQWRFERGEVQEGLNVIGGALVC